MQIAVPTPVSDLIIDPLAGQTAGAVVPVEAQALQVQGRDIREKLARLESALFAGETVDLPVKHHFSRGVYARELFIPLAVGGGIHRLAHGRVVQREQAAK